jgi:hypothetical protein
MPKVGKRIGGWHKPDQAVTIVIGFYGFPNGITWVRVPTFGAGYVKSP